MKKIFAIIFLSIFHLGYSQIFNGKDLSKLSPQEKREIFWQHRENIMIEELKIEKQNLDAFKKIYRNYLVEQRKIKDNFNPKLDIDKLSDAEASERLEKSFQVGQSLLNCRIKYSKELQKVLSQKQILKMFQIEGAMKEKMMKKHENNKPKEY